MSVQFSYRLSLLLTIFLQCQSLSSYAFNDHDPDKGLVNSNTGFIENKGQVIDQNNKPNPAVLYLLNTPGMNVQLRRGGFSYDVYSVDYSKIKDQNSKPQLKIQNQGATSLDPYDRDSDFNSQFSILNFHRIDFDLIGSNPTCEVIAARPSSDYLNYYTTGTPVEGVTYVRSFQTVSYKNIYPGIDLEFMTDEQHGVKYNFVVNPGGKLSSIRMKIMGPEIDITSTGSLKLTTTIGTMKEEIPHSFYRLNDRTADVKCRFYQIRQGIYGFSADQRFPENSTLLIDPVPQRLWSTYYGGNDVDFAVSMSLDPNGNIIITGQTLSVNNIATSGSFQTIYAGNADGYFAKFNPAGLLLFGTYFGGPGNDGSKYCCISEDGSIYLAGTTNSSFNIATPGSFQQFKNDTTDAFLVKFTSFGQRIWGSYYGGSNVESGICCCVSGTSLYFCGTTNSPNNIATINSFQPSLGGMEDAFLVKFDTSGSRKWGTYYGGSSVEAGSSIRIINDTILFLAGATMSSSNISTSGSHQPGFSGLADAFLVRFDTSGQRRWGTYYGGLQYEGNSSIVSDKFNRLYLSGSTASLNNMATPGSFQPSLAGSTDGYLARFNIDGQRIWATYYGGLQEDLIYNLACDDSAYVFITGATSSNLNIATPNSFQPNKSGLKDTYLAKFDSTGQRIWATYYGSDGSESGTAVVTIGDTQYLLGNTESLNSIATPNGWQPVYGGGGMDGFLVKFYDCPVPDPANPIIGPASLCSGTTGIIYTTTPVNGASGYEWTVPAGATIISGQNTLSITVDFGIIASSGNVTVRGFNACGQGEPAALGVTVTPAAIPTIIGAVNVVQGMAYFYSTESGMTNYQWTVTGGTIVGGNPNGTYVQVSWNTPGIQSISVSYTNPAGCSAPGPTVVNVTVNLMPVADFTAPDTVCVGNNVQITNLTQNGTTWQWYLCSGNAAADPVGTNVGNPGGYLYNPGYITLAKQNNDCFSFVSCKGSGVIRYYHGSSFYNPPVSWTSLGTFGLLTPNEEGIQVKYDDVTGNWYGWVNNENTIIRLNFGNSLWNTPTAVNIGPFPQFTMASGLVIANENNAWVGFVTCTTGKLLRLSFGTSPTNTPVIWDIGTFGGNLLNPSAMSLVYEATYWSLYILAGNNMLFRANLGSSLTNPPSGINLGSPMGFTSPSGISMTRDCNATIGYFTNVNSNELGRLTFASTYTIIVLGNNLGNVGGLVGPYSISEIARENDSIVSWITNMSNSTMTRLVFLPCTNASVSTSNFFDPPPYCYNQTGNFNVQLLVDEGQATQTGTCKPIVVVDPITVNLGNDQSVCPGNPAILDAGPGFSGYLWSTGATTQIITALTAGTYSVTVTKWSCSASDEVNVTYLPYPQPSLGPDQTICTPQTATFDAGTCSGCTYEWKDLGLGLIVGTNQTYTTGNAGIYAVTVTGQNGCTGKDTIQVLAGIPAVVTATIATGSTAVCAGTLVSFTSNATNAGSLPVYQWKVNGINASNASNAVYTYTPVNGDCIVCEVTSNAVCVTGNPATSNQICMTVNPVMPVSVTISTQVTTVCAGTPATFTALPVNPGTTPVYQWEVNGTNAGNNTSAFTYAPVNGDCITCRLTSNVVCPAGNPAMSNPICMTVNPLLPVSVTVSTPINPVCAGTVVAFTAAPVNGGPTPTYQWKVNAANATNASNSTYTYVPANGDLVSCVLTASGTCITGSPANSQPVTMTVTPLLPVTVSIVSSANPFCLGSPVTFTAAQVNGGVTPSYLWKVNGATSGTNSSVFTYNPASGDLVSCILTSSDLCVTGNPATSNLISMVVNSNLPAGVSVVASSNPFCPGSPVTYTATPVNGGLSPSYQWKINGANAGTNSSVYTYTPTPGDSIRCIITSNLNCVTGNPASSGKVIMSANPVPNVSFTSCFDTVTIFSAKPYKLKGGLPPGGQYTGPGVNSSTEIFNPSAAGTGLKTIQYSYSNVYTCLSAMTKTILVQPVPSFICGNNLTDIRDNKVYRTVQTGTQCWFRDNLNFGTQISDLIPQTDNCTAEKYLHNSIFYQWDELMLYSNSEAVQGLCPPGWHIPSSSEWNALLTFYDGPGQAGGPMKDHLLSNGFDSYQQGFFYLNNLWSFTTGLYAGSMYWTSTLSGADHAVARGFNEYNTSVSMYPASRGNAFSVRCLKDFTN
jgi:uncharacterized protein (TIGR02145 family)